MQTNRINGDNKDGTLAAYNRRKRRKIFRDNKTVLALN